MANNLPLEDINRSTENDGQGDTLFDGAGKINITTEEVRDTLDLLRLTVTSTNWGTVSTGNGIMRDDAADIIELLGDLEQAIKPDELQSFIPNETITVSGEIQRTAITNVDGTTLTLYQYNGAVPYTTSATFDQPEEDKWTPIGPAPQINTLQFYNTGGADTSFRIDNKNIQPNTPVYVTNANRNGDDCVIEFPDTNNSATVVNRSGARLYGSGLNGNFTLKEGETALVRWREDANVPAQVVLLREKAYNKTLTGAEVLEPNSEYLLDASGGAFTLDMLALLPTNGSFQPWAPVAGDTIVMTKTDASGNIVTVTGLVAGDRFVEGQGTEWKFRYDGTNWIPTPAPANVKSQWVGMFFHAKSGMFQLADGYLPVNPGTIANGALLYPIWAANYPEYVSGNDIVFPANVADMYIRNIGGNAAAEGVFQADATAANGLNFRTYIAGSGGGTNGGLDRNSLWGGHQTSTDGGNQSNLTRVISQDAETRPNNRAYQLYTIVDGHGQTVPAGTLGATPIGANKFTATSDNALAFPGSTDVITFENFSDTISSGSVASFDGSQLTVTAGDNDIRLTALAFAEGTAAHTGSFYFRDVLDAAGIKLGDGSQQDAVSSRGTYGSASGVQEAGAVIRAGTIITLNLMHSTSTGTHALQSGSYIQVEEILGRFKAVRPEAAQLIDDDTFTTATADTVPSSESVKAYVDSNIPTSFSNLGNWQGVNLNNVVANGMLIGAGTGSAVNAPSGAFTGSCKVTTMGRWCQQDFLTGNAPGTVVGERFSRQSFNADAGAGSIVWTGWFGQ